VLLQSRNIPIIGLLVLSITTIVLVIVLYWNPNLCEVVLHTGPLPAFPLFVLGVIMLACVALAQWWAVSNLWKVNSTPLSEVERLHPRLPGSLEVLITLLLSIVLLTLFIQLSNAVPGDLFDLSSSTTQTNDSRKIVMADFDLDGDLDYVVGNDNSASDFYLNSGTGAFVRHSTIATSEPIVGMHAADMDGDGDMDIVFAFEDSIKVAYNRYANSSSGFSIVICAPTCPVGGVPYASIALGDIDNDGDVDAVIGRNYADWSHVLLNTGTGNLVPARSTFSEASAVALGEFTNDHSIDLALIDLTGNLKVYRNSGTGSFTAISSKSPGNLLPVLALGDIDNDGTVDIVSANSSQRLYINTTTASGGLRTKPVIVTTMAAIKSVALGDINNDGHLDIVVAGNSSGGMNGGVVYFLNDGAGDFVTEYTTTESDDNTEDIALGEIDGDGDLDYVRANKGTVANRHYLNKRALTSANALPTTPTNNFSNTSVYPPTATGAAIVSNSGTGAIAWSSTSNAGKSDDAYAVTAGLSVTQQTEYLRATGFKFRVATGATVQGIEVYIERKASGNDAIKDAAVQLVKAGTVQTTNKANTSSFWSLSDTTEVYGGPADLWGGTFNNNDVNFGNFGVALSAKNFSGSSVVPSVDSITIKVYTNQTTIILSWGSGSDAESATKVLQYQPRMGTGSASNNYISGKVASPFYSSRMMGNGQSRRYVLHDVPCNDTYYWSVYTLDNGLRASSFSTENTFAVDLDCTVSGGSGGGSGGSGGEEETGGGWGWGVINQGNKQNNNDIIIPDDPTDIPSGYGAASLYSFFDTKKNGNRESGGERGRGIGNMKVTISGHTYRGKSINKNVTLPLSGELRLLLTPSDEKGYTFTLEKNTILTRYKLASKERVAVVEADTETIVNFGFRLTNLQGYKPCLKIVPGTSVASGGESDLTNLYAQLYDIYGEKISASIQGPLVTRSEFYRLFSRLLCVTPAKDLTELKALKVPEFTDLQREPLTPNAQVLYALAAKGVTVTRPGTNTTDYSNFITRADAIQAIYESMNLGKDVSFTSKARPVDLKDDDSIANAYGVLDSLGVIPLQYRTILCQACGMTPDEVLELVMKAALVSGHIDLTKAQSSEHSASIQSVPTFLTLVPKYLPLKSYLQIDENRYNQFTFLDVLPGHPFYESLQTLMQYWIPNSQGERLYLHPGTNRLTEFGIPKGQALANLSEPVSAIKVERALQIALGWPWAARSEGDQKKVIVAGTANQFSNANIFGLSPSILLLYRIAIRAETPVTLYNFSLFTFAPELQRLSARSPWHPFSLYESAQLFASAFLVSAANQGAITPQEAGNLAADAHKKILEYLAGQAGISPLQARNTMTTTGDLYKFLIVLTEAKFETSSAELKEVSLSDAEAWFARLFASY